MSNTAIHIENLRKTFIVKGGAEFHALSGASASIAQGECVLLMGPSGSGKTTLLTLLACLDKPTAGSYVCLGQAVHKWSEKFLTAFRQQHIGVVFQQFNLMEGFTVSQQIGMPLLPLGLSRKKMAFMVQEAAEKANIAHKLDAPATLLSGGEQQRVAIARALVASPPLIFADEPTAHLDAANAQAMLQVLQALKDKGHTLVITTHDPAVSQHEMVDRRLLMADGKLA
jgi:putative ABC transport system ATP-binding protein